MPLVEPLPFPFEHDWSQPFIEEREHLTTIYTADDESEYRASLIVIPQRRFTQFVTALAQQEFAMVQARLWGGQRSLWWAPYWPKERYLSADLAISNTAVAADGIAMKVQVGQGLLFYRSPIYMEVAVVSARTNSVITVAPLTRSWRGSVQRDKIVPCYHARLLLDSTLQFRDVDLSQSGVTFQLEPGL